MISGFKATVFSRQRERTSRTGESFKRMEGYAPLSELVALVDNATKQGHTMVKVLPRVYEKDGENRIATEISTFKGTTKVAAEEKTAE